MRDVGVALRHRNGDASLPEADAGTRAVTGHGRRSAVLALGALVVLAVCWTSSAWLSPARRSVGYGGDTYPVVWCLGWFSHALAHGINPFVSYSVNAPTGVNLMWQTSMPLLAVALTPLTLVAGPLVSYNLVATAAPALAGWVAFLAFRRWTRPLPAFAGAVVFAFSPFMTVQAAQHVFLTFCPSAPLLLILLDRLLVRQERPAAVDGGLVGAVAACQLLISEEILAAEAVVAAVVVAVLVWRHRAVARRKIRHALRGLAIATMAAVAVTAWPLYEQFHGAARVTQQLRDGAQFQFVADALGFVTPSPPLLVMPHAADMLAFRFTGNWTEWDSYVGLPLLAFLALCILRFRRSPMLRFGCLLAGVPAMLSLGPSLHVGGHDTRVPLPWVAAAHLPVLKDLLPTRFAVLTFLGIGLLIAVGLDRLRETATPYRWVGYVLFTTGLVAVAPQAPSDAHALSVPAAFTRATVCPRAQSGRIVVLPFQNDTLVWQTAAHYCYRTESDVNFNINGRYNPDGTPHERLLIDAAVAAAADGRPLPVVTGPLRREIRLQDEREHVVAVVLGTPEPGGQSGLQPMLAQWVTAALQEQPRQLGDVQVWAVPVSAGGRGHVAGAAGGRPEPSHTRR